MRDAPQLAESERARLLGVIGIERYQRRAALAVAGPAGDIDAPMSSPPTPPAPARAVTAKAPAAAPEPVVARASLLDELGAASRTPKLLLIVESPRAPDPRTKPMFAAIRSLLPPHQVVAASDTPDSWPKFAVALGGQHQAPASTHFVQALSLQYLRGNAAAKRKLWQALRPLLRAIRGV